MINNGIKMTTPRFKSGMRNEFQSTTLDTYGTQPEGESCHGFRGGNERLLLINLRKGQDTHPDSTSGETSMAWYKNQADGFYK